MGDIEYWYKTYSDRVTSYEAKIDAMGPVAAGDVIEDQVAGCVKVEKKAEKDKKNIGMEVRLIKDPETKSQWESRIKELDDRLAAAKRALATKKEQAELFGNSGRGGNPLADGKSGHIGPTNDQYLDKTEAIHDNIDASLENTLNMVNEAEEVGGATLEALAAQRTQIEGIHGTVLNIEDALKRSDALLRTFGKRMATDKMIQFFFMLNVLGLIAIIVYAALRDQGLADDDAAAADDATPSTDDYRTQASDASGSSGSTSSGRRLDDLAASAARSAVEKVWGASGPIVSRFQSQVRGSERSVADFASRVFLRGGRP